MTRSWRIVSLEQSLWRRTRPLGTVVVVAAMAIAALGSVACSHDDEDLSAFHGVRLGMTATDVRARFKNASAGGWKNDVAKTGEQALTWTADDPNAEIRRASFEFHSGTLAAVRADESAGAADLKPPGTRSTAVTVRAIAPPTVTILARDCPTHAAEVAALLKTAAP